MKSFFLLFLTLFFINGCGSVVYKQIHVPEDSIKIERLKNQLLTVSTNEQEAQELATLGITYPKVLANRYNLVEPPLYHNFLVNSGQRKRGLCFHFVEDIMREIKRHNFQSFQFHWGRANADELNEHNVIVVTGDKNSNFKDGIILDGWRNSGRLFSCKVLDDPKYEFKEWQVGNERFKGF
jgi:uncharacterized protein YceK